MIKSPLTEVPYRYFKEFIAPATDRFAFLNALLDKLDLRRSTLTIAGHRHFMVFPPLEGQSLPEEEKKARGHGGKWNGTALHVSSVPIVLVAHYDRVADSPGANDNSAAVFLLIETAMKLRQKKSKNWIIIFTDKEELTCGEGIKSQGSYTLAMGLRRAGLGGGRFFIFDACGTGDTLIISTTADHLMKNEKGLGITKTRQAVQQLRNLALETTRELHMDKVLLLPTPFSDDAGFLRAGIPAQTITVLPGKEAGPFISLLRNKPGLDQALVNREIQQQVDRRLIPETWRRLNGPGDSYPRLTPEHFFQVVRFACALSKK
ncbi:MAG: Zn-dependent exopeptidase M28 [Spirochaetaceae bacterium]|jgi:hypothetical protein|nr:Zn-dependent exopeptidase M28 [Spirochaetaceae bacterium]